MRYPPKSIGLALKRKSWNRTESEEAVTSAAGQHTPQASRSNLQRTVGVLVSGNVASHSSTASNGWCVHLTIRVLLRGSQRAHAWMLAHRTRRRNRMPPPHATAAATRGYAAVDASTGVRLSCTVRRMTCGSCSTTSKSRLEEPSGIRTPCSHARTVPTLTFRARANSGCERPRLSRSRRIRADRYRGGNATFVSRTVRR